MITLYSMPTCPRCKVLKMKLKQKNIKYNEINDPAELEKLGIKSVPMLKVGDQLLNFVKANKWANKPLLEEEQ